MEFTQAIADEICERIADGNSLRSICSAPNMPTKTSVFRWLDDERFVAFRDQYARAREKQADSFVDEIQEIADEECLTTKTRRDGEEFEQEIVFDAVAVQRNKMRIDARKWMAGKLKPKVYGDKLAVGGDDSMPPIQVQRIERVIVRPANPDA